MSIVLPDVDWPPYGKALGGLDAEAFVRAFDLALENAIENLTAGTGDMRNADNLEFLNDFQAARTFLDVFSTAETDQAIANAIAGVIVGAGGIQTLNGDAGPDVVIDFSDVGADQLGAAAQALLDAKAYADGIAAGLSPRASCRVATDVPLPTCTYDNGPLDDGVGATLTATGNGALTIDTVAVTPPDRVLVKNQVNGFEDGIYDVTDEGSVGTPWILTRSTDADASAKVPGGMVTFIFDGTPPRLSGTFVQLTPGPLTIGTDTQFFDQSNAAVALTFSNGLALASGNVAPTYGTTVNTVAQGNDSRFTDARTPLAHKTSHQSGGADELLLSESQVTNLTANLAGKLAASLNLSDVASPSTVRTNLGVAYGTTAGTVAEGNDSRFGSGGPPTGSATGDLAGTYPAPTLAAIGSATGPIGNGTTVPVVTIDTKGRVTALTSTAITGAPPTGTAGGSLAGSFPNPTLANANLNAIGALTGAANKGVMFTGLGAASTYDLSAAGLALLDDADNTAQRVTLGLVIGTNVEAHTANLTALSGLTSAADTTPYFTGSGTAALAAFPYAGRAVAAGNVWRSRPNLAWRAALGNAANLPAKIALITDSEGEVGTFINFARDVMARFPGSSPTLIRGLGGAAAGYLFPWTTTGTLTQGRGATGRYVALTSGQTLTLDRWSQKIRVHWLQNTGTFDITIDGVVSPVGVSTTNVNLAITKTNGSATIGSAALFTAAMVGLKITGTGIPADTYIAAVGSASSATMSRVATNGTSITATVGYSWTSPDLAAGNHDIMVTGSTGTTKIDLVFYYVGNYDYGAQVWLLAHTGWSTPDMAALSGVGTTANVPVSCTDLQDVLAQEQFHAVVFETCINDGSSSAYQTSMDALMTATATTLPNATLCLFLPEPKSAHSWMTATPAIAQTLATTHGALLADMNVVANDHSAQSGGVPDTPYALTYDGIHYQAQGALLASQLLLDVLDAAPPTNAWWEFSAPPSDGGYIAPFFDPVSATLGIGAFSSLDAGSPTVGFGYIRNAFVNGLFGSPGGDTFTPDAYFARVGAGNWSTFAGTIDTSWRNDGTDDGRVGNYYHASGSPSSTAVAGHAVWTVKTDTQPTLLAGYARALAATGLMVGPGGSTFPDTFLLRGGAAIWDTAGGTLQSKWRIDGTDNGRVGSHYIASGTPSTTAVAGHAVWTVNTDTQPVVLVGYSRALAATGLMVGPGGSTFPDTFMLRGGAGIWDVAGGTIRGLATTTPTLSSGAVSRGYIDRIAQIPVRAVATADLPASTYANGTLGVGATLTASANGALVAQDGVTLVAGDRFAVAFQNSSATDPENGIYDVTQVGDAGTPWILTRTAAFDQAAEMTAGTTFMATEGTMYAGTEWYLVANVATVGTTGVQIQQKRLGVSGIGSFNNVGFMALGFASSATAAPDVKFTRTASAALAIVGQLTINTGITMGDAKDIVLNTGTGTKIGTGTTQKLGFYNSAPVAQQANTVDLVDVFDNLGLRAAGGNPPLDLGTGAITCGAVTASSTLSVTGHVTTEGVTSTGATGTGKFVFDGTPTLVTPVIGVATGTSLAVTGLLKSSSATAGVGYATGAGGAVTQLTSKTTAFPTISKCCGTLTWNNASLAANTTATSASSTNTAIAATDVVVFTHISGGTIGAYTMNCTPAAGTWTLSLHNTTDGALGEAPVFAFAIIKGVTS